MQGIAPKDKVVELGDSTKVKPTVSKLLQPKPKMKPVKAVLRKTPQTNEFINQPLLQLMKLPELEEQARQSSTKRQKILDKNDAAEHSRMKALQLRKRQVSSNKIPTLGTTDVPFDLPAGSTEELYNYHSDRPPSTSTLVPFHHPTPLHLEELLVDRSMEKNTAVDHNQEVCKLVETGVVQMDTTPRRGIDLHSPKSTSPEKSSIRMGPANKLRVAGAKRPKLMYSKLASTTSSLVSKCKNAPGSFSALSGIDTEAEHCARPHETLTCGTTPMDGRPSQDDLNGKHGREDPLRSFYSDSKIDRACQLESDPDYSQSIVESHLKSPLYSDYHRRDFEAPQIRATFKDHRSRLLNGATRELASMDFGLSRRSTNWSISNQTSGTSYIGCDTVNCSMHEMVYLEHGGNVHPLCQQPHDVSNIPEVNPRSQHASLSIVGKPWHFNKSTEQQLVESNGDLLSSNLQKKLRSLAVVPPQEEHTDCESGAWTREAFDLFGWRLGDAKGAE